MKQKFWIPFTVWLFAMLVTGCQTTELGRSSGPIPESLRSEMGRLAIELRGQPEIQINGATRNKVEGAGKGALEGAVFGSLMALQSGPIGILFIPSFATIGAGTGVVAGAIVAKDADTSKANIETAENILWAAENFLQQSIEHELSSLNGWSYKIVDEEGSADTLANSGSDFQSRLVLSLNRLSSTGTKKLSPRSEVAFSWNSSVQLFVGDEATLVEERDYQFDSRTMPLAKWVQNGGLVLEGEVSKMASLTAQRVVDDFLRNEAVFVVPEYPLQKGLFGPKRVNTLHPVLRWSLSDAGGPVDYDVESSAEYRLAVTGSNGEKFLFEGLKENSMEVELRPNEEYRWRVQARYIARGRSRTTEWSREYPFRTPR